MNLTIEKTTDYSKFQLMGGNRPVNYHHVARLEKEMQYDPDMLAAQPLLVNENFFIIDGQHRFKAAKNLGLPLYYIMKEGASIEAARHLNVTQKKWTVMDFARSYAAAGNKHYIDFVRTVEKYPQLTTTIVRLFLQKSIGRTDSTGDFRRGGFEVTDLEQGHELCEMLVEIQRITGVKANATMAYALMEVLENEEFDWDTFITKLHRDTAREHFTAYASRRDMLRAFEDVYNFQSRHRTRLY